MIDVFLAVVENPTPVRDAFTLATVRQWETLLGPAPNHLWIRSFGPNHRDRLAWAAEHMTADWGVVADDDCLLRPLAIKSTFKSNPEPWHDYVARIFAARPDLGMVSALPEPHNTPQHTWRWLRTHHPEQVEVWTDVPAIGGIRFVRRDVLRALVEALPAEGPNHNYDREVICPLLRQQGWQIGYLPALPCFHLGFGNSAVGRWTGYRANWQDGRLVAPPTALA